MCIRRRFAWRSPRAAAVGRYESQRWQCGRWDSADPVALAILNLVMAQNAVAMAITEAVDYGGYRILKDGMPPNLVLALKARVKAADELMMALAVCPDAFQGPGEN